MKNKNNDIFIVSLNDVTFENADPDDCWDQLDGGKFKWRNYHGFAKASEVGFDVYMSNEVIAIWSPKTGIKLLFRFVNFEYHPNGSVKAWVYIHKGILVTIYNDPLSYSHDEEQIRDIFLAEIEDGLSRSSKGSSDALEELKQYRLSHARRLK